MREESSVDRDRRLHGMCAVLIALAWCVAPPPAAAQQCDRHCGTERWAVKTLTDTDAARVDTTPRAATVAGLIALQVPASVPLRRSGRPALPPNARIVPIELTTYRVEALLLGWKLEKDEDFHIVIADPRDTTLTMIAEIPSPTCPEVCQTTLGERFGVLRQQVETRLGLPSSRFHRLPEPLRIEITGVGFFDFIHGQTGVAPNGIELHPVTAIRFP
jgi:hypothetical protein